MSKKLKKAFGAALRDARKKRQLSQLELASTSGVDRAYVSELERGFGNPSVDMMFRLCEAMEMSPVDLTKMTLEKLGRS